jgi:DNA-binding NarL/FixJ family response regulator
MRKSLLLKRYSRTTAPLMKLKVAVVGEQPIFCEGIRSLLSRQDDLMVVAEARDAREGYALIEEHQPDLVLLYAQLAPGDGLVAAREILRRNPARPLLMWSCEVEEHRVADALDAGAKGYVGMAQPLDQILDAMRTVAQGKQYVPPSVSAAGLESRRRRGREGPIGILSAREREVFDLLVRAMTNEAIAEQLGISRRTVETHRSRILKKLRVHSAVELIRLAARYDLLGS